MDKFTLNEGQIDLYHDDCFNVFPLIPDGSIDTIIADLPYGTTENKWDICLPLDKLWDEYKRMLKSNGVVVLFGSQPFTTDLINSNRNWFKYEWIWDKGRPFGFIHAKNKPLKQHENILIFSNGTTNHKNSSVNRMTYNPQGLVIPKKPIIGTNGKKKFKNNITARPSHKDTIATEFTNYPKSIIKFVEHNVGDKLERHPTQKPLELLEYLVKTYTNDSETVLDNTMGSGTTGVACINTNRKFVGVELYENYFKIAIERCQIAHKQLSTKTYTHLSDLF